MDEEKKAEVLAECGGLCPIVNKRVKHDIFWFHRYDEDGWEITGPNGYPLIIQRDFNDAGIWEMAHLLLGLDSRRLEEEAKAEMQTMGKALNFATQDTVEIRDRALKLVAALEEMVTIPELQKWPKQLGDARNALKEWKEGTPNG